jgi:hypothetical protein
MKLKTLFKQLAEFDPDLQVTYLTGPGQYGKVTGASLDTSTKVPKVQIDVVEDDKSWNNPPY